MGSIGQEQVDSEKCDCHHDIRHELLTQRSQRRTVGFLPNWLGLSTVDATPDGSDVPRHETTESARVRRCFAGCVRCGLSKSDAVGIGGWSRPSRAAQLLTDSSARP